MRFMRPPGMRLGTSTRKRLSRSSAPAVTAALPQAGPAPAPAEPRAPVEPGFPPRQSDAEGEAGGDRERLREAVPRLPVVSRGEQQLAGAVKYFGLSVPDAEFRVLVKGQAQDGRGFGEVTGRQLNGAEHLARLGFA